MSQVKSCLEGIEYVFLDEVSMLFACDIYKISYQLSCVLNVYDKPFSDMNMVFAGDLWLIYWNKGFRQKVTRIINWKGIMAPSNHNCNFSPKYVLARAK